MAPKPRERLIFHSESDSYYVGPESDLTNMELSDVTGIPEHEHDAAIFCGAINLTISPERLAKSGSEHGHQKAVFCWLAHCAGWYEPFKWAFAIGNGGSRGDTEQSRKIAGGMMKAEGVKCGVPDFMIPEPRFHRELNAMFAGLWIEMKDATGGDGGSEYQHEYIARLNEVGYAAQICNGWKEAIAAIVRYFEIERRVK